MPDEQGKTKADHGETPKTSLHAYKDGREDEIKGDVEKLNSDDPKQQKQAEIASDDEPSVPKKA